MASNPHIPVPVPVPSTSSLATTIVGLLLLLVFARHRWKIMKQKDDEDNFGALYGCRRMKAKARSKWPLSMDLAKRLASADKAGHMLAYQQQFIDELGPNFEHYFLGNYGLVTLDPINVEAILSRSMFRKGEQEYVFGQRRDAFVPMVGKGLFTQEGAPWKDSRELLRRQFAKIRYLNLDIFKDHVELLISRFRSSNEAVVDLQPLFFKFTLDTTTSLLFGESAGSLHEVFIDEFESSFDVASRISAMRTRLVDFYWLYTPRRYIKACNQVKKYADNYVRKGLAHGDDEKESDSYPFIKSLHGELKSPELVRDQLINVLLAGRDTTACCLSWTLRLLVRHKSVLEKLQEEIRSVLGNETTVTKAIVQRMPYLRDVIMETLRLYPSVPLNVRFAKAPTILPRGGGSDGRSPVLVRKGMGVAYSPYHMHRRTDLYGKDANEFRPERWSNGELVKNIGWGYLPFNDGPRVCLGREFALLEISYAIIRILQEFPNLALPKDEKIEPIGSERQTITLTIFPSDGCRVKLW